MSLISCSLCFIKDCILFSCIDSNQNNLIQSFVFFIKIKFEAFKAYKLTNSRGLSYLILSRTYSIEFIPKIKLECTLNYANSSKINSLKNCFHKKYQDNDDFKNLINSIKKDMAKPQDTKSLAKLIMLDYRNAADKIILNLGEKELGVDKYIDIWSEVFLSFEDNSFLNYVVTFYNLVHELKKDVDCDYIIANLQHMYAALTMLRLINI